jgi:hypothetical protein
MNVLRCPRFVLAGSLVLASLLACAQRLPPTAPTWSRTLELASLAALPARIARPFREPIDLVRGEAHSSAGNCAALLAARAENASPADDRDLAIERDEGAKCIVLEQLSHARGAPGGALDGFDLRTARAAQLPPTLAVPFGKRDDARAQAAEARGQTLRDYLPDVVVQAGEGALVLKGDTWETRAEALARGDFDGSGRDELLLAAHDKATEGTFESTRLLLVARRGGDGALTTLKRLQ